MIPIVVLIMFNVFNKILIATLVSVSMAAPSSVISFTVALPQSNINILKQAVMNMSDYKNPEYGHFWPMDKILNLIAPPTTVPEHLVSVFRKENISCANHQDALVCEGLLNDVHLFFKMDSQQPNYIVPESLKPFIVFIDGLSNRKLPNNIKTKRNVKVHPKVLIQ